MTAETPDLLTTSNVMSGRWQAILYVCVLLNALHYILKLQNSVLFCSMVQLCGTG